MTASRRHKPRGRWKVNGKRARLPITTPAARIAEHDEARERARDVAMTEVEQAARAEVERAHEFGGRRSNECEGMSKTDEHYPNDGMLYIVIPSSVRMLSDLALGLRAAVVDRRCDAPEADV